MARSKRRSLFSAMLAVLIPQPIMAFESGVNAMEAVQEVESKSILAWAYSELQELQTGFRALLDPIIPEAPKTFSVLDSEIANFISEGHAIEARIDSIIQELEQIDIVEPVSFVSAYVEPMPAQNTFTVFDNGVHMPMLNVGVNDKGQFQLDASDLVDLPDVTIDPRDGGEYTSEVPIVQSVLDIIQEAQNQVPAPIQSLGTDTYNTVLEATLNVNRSS